MKIPRSETFSDIPRSGIRVAEASRAQHGHGKYGRANWRDAIFIGNKIERDDKALGRKRRSKFA